MKPLFALPAPALPSRPLTERVSDVLLHRRSGRLFLFAAAVSVADWAGLGIPEPVPFLGKLVLAAFVLWGATRLALGTLRVLLWRIRSKLILSYLFIAVVPMVLLALLVALAAMLFSGLVGSHILSAEIEKTARTLESVARSALTGLPPGPVSRLEVERRVEAARAVHPRLRWSLTRAGSDVGSEGARAVPRPSWWDGPGFAGLVRAGGEEVVRGAWTNGSDVLVLDVPVDAELFRPLEQRTGIQPVTFGGRIEPSEQGGVRVEVKDGEARRLARADSLTGMIFIAPTERVDWATGKKELDPLTFQYQPQVLVRRLSPGSLDLAELLVRLLALVGAVFLVVYVVALALGLLLARSITKSVHALTLGTLRLRQGNFEQAIPIGSRDQLGELAESFNVMMRSVQDLLREHVEKQRLEEELRIARQIQMSLLPRQGLALPGVHVAALCLPAAEVGGDYYDLLPLSETRMGVLVADVSGKGTSAALYMAELKGLVLSLSRIHDSPARLLSEANRILSANMDRRTFITMTYAVVDVERRLMRYARAGHNPILHLKRGHLGSETHVLSPAGLGLGLDRGERFDEILEEAEVPLVPGDAFLFFTDGLSEAMNEEAELFGEERLRALLLRHERMPGEELKDRILDEVRAFAGGASQHDDMTMVILQVV